jgi:DNA-binding HxlR family transcriptional regulator
VAAKRTYGDSCGIARALDIVGERWAVLVARELVLGPKRFTDLREGLPKLGPDMLAQRLRDLEVAGVVRRRTLPAPAASRVYELTDWGAELQPVLVALGRWGSRAPLPDPAPALSADAAIVALETTFDPAAAGDLHESYEIRLGDQTFSLTVAGGHLEVARGEQPGRAVLVDTDTATLAAVVWHGRPLSDAIDLGDANVRGDRSAAERLLSLFRAPVRVAVGA